MPYIPLVNLTGPATEWRHSGGYLQYRTKGSTDPNAWANVLALTAIQGLPAPTAIPTVDAIATYVSAIPANAAQAAMDARFANKGTVALKAGAAYNLDVAPGVDPTGTTECAAAIQAAADFASANNLTLVSRAGAQYKIGSTVTLRDHADLSRAVFNYTGTSGVAICVGNPPVSIVRKSIKTPYIIATAKTVVGWGQVAGTVGIDVVNLSDCEVVVGTIRNFETGLRVRGQGVGGGTTYSRFFLGTILNNKVNMRITTDGVSGYVNQNQTFGGSFNFDGAEGVAVSGTRHVLLEQVPQAPDGWTFHELSLEDSGAVCEFHIESFGHNNVYDNCRFEVAGGVPKVRWGAGSQADKIRQGVNVDAVVETVAPGATNSIERIAGTKLIQTARTLNNTDEGKTLISSAASTVTYSLPSAATRSPGTKVTVKNIAASAVTVNGAVDTIDGASSVALAQWQSRTFMVQHLPTATWITV